MSQRDDPVVVDVPVEFRRGGMGKDDISDEIVIGK